jgi:hypothetical protein
MQLDRAIFRGFADLEASIGVAQGFFAGLQHEDDWSFIIKLHAVFEATVTHLLTYHFKEEPLSELFARLELSNKTTGKLAFLKALELVGKENRRYISSLSELRNVLVHDVRNCSFDLKEMVGGYTDKELRGFAVSFNPSETRRTLVLEEPPHFKDVSAEEIRELMDQARKNPK